MNDLGVGPLEDPTGNRAAVLFVKYAAPGWILDGGTTADVFEAPKLPVNFADLGMKYPIHTPAAVWASAAAFHDSGATNKSAADRIRQSMVYHRLPADEWSRLEKAATPVPYRATKFALPETGKYPIDSPEQVKTAAAYFTKWGSRFDPDTRRVFAGNLATAGVSVLSPADLVRLEAEAGWAKPAADWRNQFTMRAQLSPGGSGLPAALEKAASEVAAAGFPHGQFRTAGELAELLRQIDGKMGWSLGDPLTKLTGDTPSSVRTKLATAVEGATGDWYRPEQLDRLSDTAFSELFGGGPVVTRAEKIAAVKDPKRGPLLAAVLAGEGIFPEHRGPTQTDWAVLAAK